MVSQFDFASAGENPLIRHHPICNVQAGPGRAGLINDDDELFLFSFEPAAAQGKLMLKQTIDDAGDDLGDLLII